MSERQGPGLEPELRPERDCPICGRCATAETRPFCSRRCADVDLSRWLSGRYAIPGAAAAIPDAATDD